MNAPDDRDQHRRSAMEFRVLGPVQVEEDGVPLALGTGRRLRTLLALFLAHPNQIVATDTLIDQVWSEDPPPTAPTALRVHLTRLRSRLEPARPRATPSERLVSAPTGYRLRVGNDELDSLRFEHLLSVGGRAAEPAVQRDLLTEALGSWRGRAFADVDDVDAVRAEAMRLDELRLGALEDLCDVRLALGEHGAVVPTLQRAVAEQPLRERLAGQLMVALYRSGRQSDALRAFARLRDDLGEELGIEPDTALAQLETAILRQESELVVPPHSHRREAAAPVATGAHDLVTVIVIHDPTAAKRAVPEAEALLASGAVEEVRLDDSDARALAFRDPQDALDVVGAVLARPTPPAVGMAVGERPGGGHSWADSALATESLALARAATPGQVLASEAAAAIARPHPALAFDDVARIGAATGGLVASTGRLAPRESPRVAIPLPPLLASEERLRFSGRAEELATLRRIHDAVSTGEQRTLVISGEPGIGKTRLAAESARDAHAGGWVVFYGRCDEELRTPFQPFVEALDSFVRYSTDDDLRDAFGYDAGELSRLLPELASRLTDLEPPLHSDPETERYRMFEAVAGWLRRTAQRQPVILVLDDVHWAARPTLLLLRHLVRTPDLHRVLVVATYRDTKPERQDDLDEFLASLSRAPRADRIALTGLDEETIRLLIESVSGLRDDAAERVARFVQAETNGNPFFVDELLRHLDESGALDTPPSDQAGGVALPPAIRDVIAQRLSRLGGDAGELLRIAAVIGRDFDLATLRTVAGADEDEILDRLEAGLGARLVEETGFDTYRFTHALVQSALYAPMPAAQRVRLHRRVAEAIESLDDRPDERRVALLAHHYVEAAPGGTVDRAVRYTIEAADVAARTLAFEDAVALCQRGLTVIEHAGAADVRPTDQCDLLLRLGRSQLRSGQAGGRESLMRAFAVARELDDPARVADAALAMNRGFFSRVGRIDRELVGALEYAISRQESGDSAVLAELLATLASELIWADDGGRCFELSDRALEIARRVGDPRTLARVLLLRNLTIRAPDTLQERLDGCTELLGLAEQLQDPVIRFQTAFHRSGTALEYGDLATVRAMVALTGELASALRQPSLQWHARLMRTAQSILDGDLEEAERAAFETMEQGRRANQEAEARIFCTELLAETWRWQDRLDELDKLLPHFQDAAGVAGVDIGYALLRYVWDAGERDVAADGYHRVMREATLPPRRDLLTAPTLCNLSYLATRVCDTEHAPALAQALQPCAGTFASTTVAKPVAEHYLGMLAATVGDDEIAQGYFATAVAAHERARAPLLLAETRLEWARMLLPRDRESANALLDAVDAAAMEYGARFLLRESAAVNGRRSPKAGS
jgi:DNA-binding SARP family transcriptional activator